MRAMTMSAATLEASTATVRSTVAGAMGTIGTPIRAPAASAETAAITAAVASPALRALEPGTRVGADAGKIFAWRVRIARGAGFAGQQNGVVFDDGFHGWTVCRHRRRHGFRRNVLDGFVVSEVRAFGFGHFLAIFSLVPLLTCFGMRFRVAGFRGELRFARFVFRVLAVFPSFLFFFGFFFVVAVLFALGSFVRFVEGLGLILIKIRSTD
jgi:hypothetical protein